MRADSTPAIAVPLSRKKLALALAGSFAFVAAAVFLWHVAVDDPVVVCCVLRSIVACAAAFFGLCGLHAGIRLLDRRPGLVVDDDGLVDNSSALAAGRVSWSDVTGINAAGGYLTIGVRDEQRYIERLGFMRRPLARWNTRFTGSPVNISSVSPAIGFDELEALLTNAFLVHLDESSGRTASAFIHFS